MEHTTPTAETSLQHYRVLWEMDAYADTPLEAARQARAAQLRPGTSATVFDVTPVLEHCVLQPPSLRVDLSEVDTPYRNLLELVLSAMAAPNTSPPPETTPTTKACAPVCPQCGGASILVCVDSYAHYVLNGWDHAGEIIADFTAPVRHVAYDHRTYVCTGCNYESQNSATFAPASHSA
jgi:hypothetical protein